MGYCCGFPQSRQSIGESHPQHSRESVAVASAASERDLSAVSLETKGYAGVSTLLTCNQSTPGRALHRNGQTARAEIVSIDGLGLELRYTRNGKPFVRRIFTSEIPP